MKKTIIAISCLAAAFAAQATECAPGTAHAGQGAPYYPNRCDEALTAPAGSKAGAVAAAGALAAADAQATVKSSNRNNNAATAAGGAAKQGQRQQQQQAQRQQTTQQSEQNLSADGNGFNGNIVISTGVGGGGNPTYKTNTSTVIIPPFVPGGASPLPSSNIAIVEGICGGRVRPMLEVVMGRETHMRADTSEFVVGYSTVARPLLDENGNEAAPFDLTTMPGYVLGHIWRRSVGMAGTSMDASLAVNLFGKGGGGGGGVSAGGQVTRPMSELDIQTCVVASPLRPVIVVPTPPAPEVRWKTRTVYRDRPVTPPCCCTPVVAPACVIGK